MVRNYYVVKKDDMWRVKLEAGQYVSRHNKQARAVQEAKRLARNNNRGVTVNAAAGYTRFSINKDEL